MGHARGAGWSRPKCPDRRTSPLPHRLELDPAHPGEPIRSIQDLQRDLVPCFVGRLFRPGHTPCPARRSKSEKSITDDREQPRRQHAVGDRACIAAWCAPHVRPRPDEFIPHGKHNPRAVSVEPQAFLDRRRNFHGERGLRGRAVRDRQHQDARFAGIIGRAQRCDIAQGRSLPSSRPARCSLCQR